MPRAALWRLIQSPAPNTASNPATSPLLASSLALSPYWWLGEPVGVAGGRNGTKKSRNKQTNKHEMNWNEKNHEELAVAGNGDGSGAHPHPRVFLGLSPYRLVTGPGHVIFQAVHQMRRPGAGPSLWRILEEEPDQKASRTRAEGEQNPSRRRAEAPRNARILGKFGTR